MKKIITVRPNGTRSVKTIFEDSDTSLTVQDFRDEVDVNHIVDRFMKTGQLSHVNQNPGSYVDQFAMPQDLMSAKQFVQDAADNYDSLNRKLKNRFKSPLELIDFLQNPKNQKEAQELGLLPQTMTTQTTTNTAVTDPASTPPTPKV